ncbi:MAG TPA: hypothetical protein PLG79_06940 [Spirochaetales bacterium]|nr:hypothetical protein [Spirochaetales bacterium]
MPGLRFLETTPSPSLYPCLTCQGAPCCRRLPLKKLCILKKKDLLQAVLMLSHRWMELGLKDDGTWMLFYTRPCSNLDLKTSLCKVHGTDLQPWVCKDYAANLCWYRRAFSCTESLEFIRFDKERLEALMDHLLYDEDTEEIAGVPSWEEMIKLVSLHPLSDPSTRAEGGAPAELFVFDPPPREERHHSLFHFRTQFPGVRVVKGETRWITVVETYFLFYTIHIKD